MITGPGILGVIVHRMGERDRALWKDHPPAPRDPVFTIDRSLLPERWLPRLRPTIEFAVTPRKVEKIYIHAPVYEHGKSNATVHDEDDDLFFKGATGNDPTDPDPD